MRGQCRRLNTVKFLFWMTVARLIWTSGITNDFWILTWRDNNVTTGKIYSKVIEAERRGDYLGKTVQVIPHVTGAVQDWLEEVAHRPADGIDEAPDACIIELGGTVGDIESAPYIEALRQFQFRVGRENITFVHVSLVPVMGPVGEQKTKPTQHTVKELRGLGITPDILVCRSSSP